MARVELFGTSSRYGIEILHQCGKNIKNKSQKVFGANLYVCRSYRWKNGEGGGGGGGALSRPFCSKMRMLSGFMKKDETIYSRRRKLIIHQYNPKKPGKYEILYRSLSENKVPNI